jgi:hypothetical protein
MIRRITGCLCALLAVSLGFAQPQPAPDTSQRILSRAVQFLTDIAVYEDPLAATVIPPSPDDLDPGLWTVKWDDKVELEVIPETGKICLFSRGGLICHKDGTVTVTKEEAEAAAKAILVSAGYNLRDFSFYLTKTTNFTSNPGMVYWGVGFQRVYQGYMYEEVGGLAQVDPLSGLVMGFGVRNTVTPPKSVTMAVSCDEALALATQRLNDLGYQAGKVKNE